MFSENGHRAVELMLLSAASCLNFFLAEYVQARGLDVEGLGVECVGEVTQGPARVSRIETRVSVEGNLDAREAEKMVSMCERACKVMNTLKQSPESKVTISLAAAPGGGRE